MTETKTKKKTTKAAEVGEKKAKPAAAKKTPAKASGKKTSTKKEEAVNKLRIRVRAYEHKILDASVTSRLKGLKVCLLEASLS